jgi:NAD(P)-dependent dehydrogenase (short-subunit alcohol dehydrogenase family)
MSARLSLEGKTAIVTGGGTGLGRSMVRHLARAGARLVIAARRAGPIEETAAEVRTMGGQAIAIPTDVTRSDQVRRGIQHESRSAHEDLHLAQAVLHGPPGRAFRRQLGRERSALP